MVTCEPKIYDDDNDEDDVDDDVGGGIKVHLYIHVKK
jgi:hypothetical protein